MLAHATGSVVEIGAGTGLNLPHFPSTATNVLALEPDPNMVRRLVPATEKASIPVSVRRARAEDLPVPDGSVDTVVASLVLCSVEDPAAALAEARRVLRPGGRLLFFEHVRAGRPRLARWQDRFERLWGRFAGGCHPNRDTEAAIARAGFEIREIERFHESGAVLAAPHILGWATRP
jgi:SAM-dependent methyltransferase